LRDVRAEGHIARSAVIASDPRVIWEPLENSMLCDARSPGDALSAHAAENI
jgi:hypothetical protein